MVGGERDRKTETHREVERDLKRQEDRDPKCGRERHRDKSRGPERGETNQERSKNRDPEGEMELLWLPCTYLPHQWVTVNTYCWLTSTPGFHLCHLAGPPARAGSLLDTEIH